MNNDLMLVRERLTEIANRDSAVSVTVRTEDLRAMLAVSAVAPSARHAIPQWLRDQFDAIELAVMNGAKPAAVFTDMRTKVQAYFEMQREQPESPQRPVPPNRPVQPSVRIVRNEKVINTSDCHPRGRF